MSTPSSLLPISGYVLAGGKSSRMGVDKAELLFCGRSLAARAVERLSQFCAEVAIAGNRTGLASIAPVVTETELSVGPGAGIEAGLSRARYDWCLFTPVDVPLLPAELLHKWAADVLEAKDAVRACYLTANGRAQPSICMVHREGLNSIARSLKRGERRLKFLLEGVDFDLGAGALGIRDAAAYAPSPGATAADLERWFLNLNTPEDLAQAERFAAY